jgi:zinc transport system substrate-binding protein
MKQPVLTGSLFCFLVLAISTVGFTAPMEVFVSIPPQKWLSNQLGGELVNTHVLVDKGGDPHTYEPTPRQMTALSQAKLYFTLDLEFEEQILPRLQKTAPNLIMVDTADAIPKIAMTEHEDHGHDEHAHTAGEHHHEGGLDPHVWLSPLNLKIMAATMAEALITHDPSNKAVYEQNLLKLNQTLEQLHQKISQELSPFHDASFYVFHPAFGYFAHAYNLQQKAIETGGKSPTPKQLSALINQAKASGARVIFVQPQFDPKSAQAVATAISGEIVPLDPLAEDVVTNLSIMADRIKAALTAR